MVMAFAFVVGSFVCLYSNKKFGTRAPAFVIACDEMDRAKIYYEEYCDRLTVLNDPSITDCVLKEYTYKPYLLYFDDVRDTMEAYQSFAVAHFYGKESVIALPEGLAEE